MVTRIRRALIDGSSFLANHVDDLADTRRTRRRINLALPISQILVEAAKFSDLLI
jgi:hypothetical protein